MSPWPWCNHSPSHSSPKWFLTLHFPATSLTTKGKKPLSQEKDDSLLPAARVTHWKDTSKNMQLHCLLCISDIYAWITSPSIFLPSGSWILIVIFSEFPEDQGCSICQGTQCWGICDTYELSCLLWTEPSNERKLISMQQKELLLLVSGNLQNRHK